MVKDLKGWALDEEPHFSLLSRQSPFNFSGAAAAALWPVKQHFFANPFKSLSIFMLRRNAALFYAPYKLSIFSTINGCHTQTTGVPTHSKYYTRSNSRANSIIFRIICCSGQNEFILEKYEKLIDHALSAGDGNIGSIDTGSRLETIAVSAVVSRVSVESVSISIRMSVVTGVSTVVCVVSISGGVGLSVTLGVSVIGSTGDGCSGRVDTGGSFAAQTVVSVRIMSIVSTISVRVGSVSTSIEELRVGLGLSLGTGDSGSGNSKQDLQKIQFLSIFFTLKFFRNRLTKAFMFVLQREAPSGIN